MKKFFLPAVAFLAFASAAFAQEPDDYKPNQEADRQAITNLEQGFAHALQLNNSTVFNTVYSDEFSGTTYFGEVINKAQQIRYIQTSSVTWDFVHSSDIQVRIYRDVASVSSLLTERGSQQGKQFVRQLRILRLYINTPRGWRVVAAQETQLPGQGSR